MKNRHIRVFISSTFRDMHAERDYLIKNTFPELRRRCRERGLELTEVDLRWGVTEEQSENGEVLNICLKEIEKSRPYFIGLLGERYGWIPPKEHFHPSLLKTEKWLEYHLDKSATEMEILHGVLNNPAMSEKAHFYFRNPEYLQQIDRRQIDDFKEKDSRIEEKLKSLKASIRDSCLKLKENYNSPEELGNLVLEDLWTSIDQDYPLDSKPDPLEQEVWEHEFFAESRRKVYIGRKEYFQKLSKQADGQDPPLVIKGESGSGKTAMLANWVKEYRTENPDIFLVQYYLGASSDSTSHVNLMRVIMLLIKQRYSLEQEVPSKTDKLINAFPNWLHMAAARGRMILILDGLNQLENRENAPDLTWLPVYFPSAIRVIISILPGRADGAIASRHWSEFKIGELRADERTKLINEYLALFTKKLDKSQIQTLLAAEQTKNPLFLKVLLDELRVFGVYEVLNEQIIYYLKAQNPDELYALILNRMEKDYETHCPEMVKKAFSFIWASRHGLSENEILDLLGKKGKPLPRAFWSPLYLAMEESLVSRDGLLFFFHDYLTKAVFEKYIQNPKGEKQAHQQLGHYFQNTELSTRKANELPWQYWMAGDSVNLRKILQDLELHEFIWYYNEVDIKTYWAFLEKQVPGSVLRSFQNIIKQPSRYRDYTWNLAFLFQHFGYSKEALALQLDIAASLKEENEQKYAQCINNQANILIYESQWEKAMLNIEEAEQIYRRLGDKPGLNKCANKKGIILSDQGKLREALELFQKSESISEELGDMGLLMVSINNQASILSEWGRKEESLELLRKVENICKKHGDQEQLLMVLDNQFSALMELYRYEEAEKIDKVAQDISELLGNKDQICRRLLSRATTLQNERKSDQALELFDQAKKGFAEINSQKGVISSIEGQAKCYLGLDQFEKSYSLYKEVEQLSLEIGDRINYLDSLNGQAHMLYELGSPGKALKLLKKSEKICLDLDYKKGLANNYLTQGMILKDRNQRAKAENILKKRESLQRESGNTLGLAQTLDFRASYLKESGQNQEALIIYREVENLARQRDYRSLLFTSLNEQGNILKQAGNMKEALAAYHKAGELCRVQENMKDLESLLGEQALLYWEMKELEKAEALFGEMVRINRETGQTNKLQLTLGFQATMLHTTQPACAEKLYAEKVQICLELEEFSEAVETMVNQAEVLARLDDPENSRAILEKQEQLAKEKQVVLSDYFCEIKKEIEEWLKSESP